MRWFGPQIARVVGAQFQTKDRFVVEADPDRLNMGRRQLAAMAIFETNPPQPGDRQFGLRDGLEQVSAGWPRVGPEEFAGKRECILLRADPGDPEPQSPVSVGGAAVRFEEVPPPAVTAAGDLAGGFDDIVHVAPGQQQSIEQELAVPGFVQRRQIETFAQRQQRLVPGTQEEERPGGIDSPGHSAGPDGQIFEHRPDRLFSTQLEADRWRVPQWRLDPQRIVRDVRLRRNVLLQQQRNEVVDRSDRVGGLVDAVRIVGEQIGRGIPMRSGSVRVGSEPAGKDLAELDAHSLQSKLESGGTRRAAFFDTSKIPPLSIGVLEADPVADVDRVPVCKAIMQEKAAGPAAPLAEQLEPAAGDRPVREQDGRGVRFGSVMENAAGKHCRGSFDVMQDETGGCVSQSGASA